MQIEEENQISYRPRTTAAPPQLPTISGISDKDRARIASKKEEALKDLQKKKAKDESGQVECVKHKKQKNQHTCREMMLTPEKLKKRNIMEVEEADEDYSSKRQKS